MLTKDIILQFEEQLREIGHEIEVLKEHDQKIVSVYDPDEKEISKTVLTNIFESVYEDEDLDKSELDENQEKKPAQDFFSYSDTEEGLTEDSEVVPLETQTFEDDEDVLETQETTDLTQEDAISPQFKQDQETSTVAQTAATTTTPPPTEAPDQGLDLNDPTKDLLDSSHADNQVIIEDDIDEIENIQQTDNQDVEVFEEENNIILPAEFMTNPENTEPESVLLEDFSDKQEENLDALLGDAESLLLDESDMGEIDEIDFSDADLEKMYAQDNTKKRVVTKYRSKRDFQKEDEVLFFDNLEQYSIYLQKAIADVISDDEFVDDTERLVDLVLDKALPTVVHHEVERILKEPIKILSDTNIYTSKMLEDHLMTTTEKAKKQSRTFVTKILPVAVVIFSVVFYGFFFVIQPIRANRLYKIGYQQLEENQEEQSEISFARATSIFPITKYFHRYADLYYEKRKLQKQKLKYEQFIFGTNPVVHKYFMKKALEEDYYNLVTINGKQYNLIESIDYTREIYTKIAHMEKTRYYNFEKARMYYSLWLNKYPDDVKMHIELAHLYIDWYDYNGKELYLNLARGTYDKVLVLSEQSDKSLFLRMRWAIRAKDKEYIDSIYSQLALVTGFLKIEKDMLETYYELFHYKIENNEYQHLATLMDRVEKKSPESSDIAYFYAKYYQNYKQDKSLFVALDKSIHLYQNQDYLTKIQHERYVDSYILYAEAMLYYHNDIVAAEEYIEKAHTLFENGYKHYNITDNTYLSRLFYIQSKIALIQGDLQKATDYMSKNNYVDNTNPAIDYHKGVLLYLNQNWSQAVKTFLSIKNNVQYTFSLQQQAMLMLSLGNSLYLQKNYNAAAVYYEKTLEILDNTSLSNQDFNIIAVNLERHTNVYNYKSKIGQIKNNLGVSLYNISNQSFEKQTMSTRAFEELQNARRIIENLNRKVDVRTTITQLPSINTNTIMSPNNRQALLIYADIPVSLDNHNYWQIRTNITDINKTQ